MKHPRCTIGLVFSICLLSMVACSSIPPKVLIIARETSDNMNMMIENEVKPIQKMIRDAGFDTDIASETKTLLGSGTSTLQPNLALSEVKVADYVGIVIPCMAASDTPKAIPQVAVDIVKKASARGLPIAAQQSGVEILARAGVLVGKSFAIASGSENTVAGGIYKGIGVVQDGKIITSGTCPFLNARMGLKDGTIEMTEGFIKMIKR
jgi:putative intracellular protease/amidase